MADTGVNAVQTGKNANAQGQGETGKITATPLDAPATAAVQVSSSPAAASIDKPAPGVTLEVKTEPGQKYTFSFARDAVQSFEEQGNDLVLRFSDKSVIKMKDFELASAGSDPAALVFTDLIFPEAMKAQMVSTAMPEDLLQEPKAGLRKEKGETTGEQQGKGDETQVAQAEQTAEQLAKIEPAAGESGAQGPGGPQNSGFTFSDPDITPVGPLNAVGPIDPTALQYSVNRPTEDLLFQPEVEDAGPANDIPELAPGDASIDESDLNPGASVSGSIPFSFGNDGPGAISSSGAFSSSGSLAGGNLTSGGVAIVVTATPDGYVGMAGGLKVFELVFDQVSTGAFTYTQFAAIDHADGANPDDVISLVFGVQATDSNGDTANTTLTIFVADDAPGLTPPEVESVNEAALAGGPVVVGDTLNVDFGNDGAGEVRPSGTSAVNGVTALTSGGQPVTIVATVGGYEGLLPGGVKVFKLEINSATGAYEYTQYKGLDHEAGHDVISLEFGVRIVDRDGDPASSSITVNVTDSVPHLNGQPDIGAGKEIVDESNLPGGSKASGQLDVNVGGDQPGTVAANGATSSSVSLTSGGQPVTITQTQAGGYVGTINGGADKVFTLTIGDNGSYTFTQLRPLDHPDVTNPDDSLTIKFGVVVTDADGDTDTGEIVIKVRDDGPVAVDDSRIIGEQGKQASGNVLTNDDVGADAPGVVTKVSFGGTDYAVTPGASTTVVGAHGTLVIKSDGSYTYTIKGGNAVDVTDKFIYTLKDADGDSDTAELKIKTADRNDDPLIVSTTPVVVDESDLPPADSGSGAVVADFGVDGPGTYVVTGAGSVTFSGAKAGALTSNGVAVVITVEGNDYVGKAGATEVFRLSLNAATGAYEFVLKDQLDHADITNPDDTITLNFGVTAKDVDGDMDTGMIVVQVKDDGPVAVDDQRTIGEQGQQASGNVLTNDDVGADAPGVVTKVSFGGTDYAVTPGASTTVVGAHGTLVIKSDGSYTYTIKGGNAVDVTDKFIYTLKDADGDTDSALLTIKTTDRNDDPVIICVEPLLVDESDLPPVDKDNGTITANFGVDGPGTYVVTGAGSVTFSGAKAGALTSNGVAVVITVEGNDYVGKAGATEVFRLSLNAATGAYEFVLKDQLDHANAGNPNDVITLNFGVTAKDVDGDMDTGMIVVQVKDDGPVAVDDQRTIGDGSLQTSGNVLTNDDVGADAPGVVTKVSFGGTDYAVTPGASTTVVGAHGTLVIKSDGSYTYTSSGHTSALQQDKFDYILKDADGDTDCASLTIKTTAAPSQLIVGDNVNDVLASTTPWIVGGGKGKIVGGDGADILIGDVGGSKIENQKQDYNILFVIDNSGSMGRASDAGSRISLLADALESLVSDFGKYENGTIKVHFAPFNTAAAPGATFTVTNAAQLAQAIAWLEKLDGDGLTNYEAGLQSGIKWLQSGEVIPDAITTTYFLSDGAPNRYVGPGGGVREGDVPTVMGEITGSDGTNEVAILKSLSDEVIGVGINIGSNISRINVIDSDGKSINIDDPNDLKAVLAGTNPLNKLTAVGADTLDGGNSNDIIFGDAVNTDALAKAQGLGTDPGAGWNVFARLENGEGSSTGWTRADTIEYIKSHVEQLGQETQNSAHEGRLGGNDVINGGAGNDVIFGQEGDDRITGGAGNDTLYGGSGSDAFIFKAITDGVDTIKDFSLSEGDVLDVSALLHGYDALQDSINDFVFSTQSGGNTIISVDETGSGNIANAVQIAVLESVTGLDLEQVVNNGHPATV